MVRAHNRDLISLKGNIKKKKIHAGKIVKSQLNHQVNQQKRSYLRIIFNIFIKF